MRPVGHYGVNPEWDSNLTAWDDSPLSEAIRSKTIVASQVTSKGIENLVIAVPLISNQVPSGVLTLTLGDLGFTTPELPAEIMEFFFGLGALYLESLDLGSLNSANGSVLFRPEELTSRQLSILGHLENELVNAEIAKILMLSESTIRQETVRIYRTLGVGNRQEAVKKARALGILNKTPPRTISDVGLVEAK